MTQVSFSAEGEPYSVVFSQIHKSLCLIVKTTTASLKKAETTMFGWTPKVKVEDAIAMSGVHVGDCLRVGPSKVVDALMTTLRKLWKTSEPQCTSFTQHLTFLGVTVVKLQDTEDLLKEHAAHLT